MVKEFSLVNSDEDYAKFVDKLMNLPSFGEKWASVWLDLARYSDSRGYQKIMEEPFGLTETGLFHRLIKIYLFVNL